MTSLTPLPRLKSRKEIFSLHAVKVPDRPDWTSSRRLSAGCRGRRSPHPAVPGGPRPRAVCRRGGGRPGGGARQVRKHLVTKYFLHEHLHI